MNEQRLVDVETKIAYQEHTLAELNDVVIEQHKRIERLEATCKSLVDRVRSLEQSIQEQQPADEKPPHY